MKKIREDKNLVPLNSDYDLCCLGEAGKTATSSTAKPSDRHIVCAGNGGFVGLVVGY